MGKYFARRAPFSHLHQSISTTSAGGDYYASIARGNVRAEAIAILPLQAFLLHLVRALAVDLKCHEKGELDEPVGRARWHLRVEEQHENVDAEEAQDPRDQQ